jgi:hypothetical protein
VSHVVLQPSANQSAREHYRDTIEAPVKLADYRELLGEKLYQHLASLFPSGRAPMMESNSPACPKPSSVTSRMNSYTEWRSPRAGCGP